jgi:N-formylglutamate deformylase
MLLVTIPHAGESIPSLCSWLSLLPEEVLFRDVDRFVDQLYDPVLQRLHIPCVKSSWHRYSVDLNRDPQDVDQDSVQGAFLPSGIHPRGFHWVKTTLGEKLLPRPLSLSQHQDLVAMIYDPFHSAVEEMTKSWNTKWHLDLHSMPSVGTSEHRDPGEKRADIVVSDQKGISSDKKFVDLVMHSYKQSGFQVAYNWPYLGGNITQRYGKPEQDHHTVQVELNRSLYMDEKTKQKNADFLKIQTMLEEAVTLIHQEVSLWLPT